MEQWVHLTDVAGGFHAKVIAARLAAEGIPARLRGFDEGPYPLNTLVHVDVRAEDETTAREILLADAVDAAFSDPEPGASTRRGRWGGFRRRGAP